MKETLTAEIKATGLDKIKENIEEINELLKETNKLLNIRI
jgi:hypothetical protein